MDLVELEMQKAATAAFIDADATTVILNRAEYEPNGAGGKRQVGPPTSAPPLTCRLVPQGVQGRLEVRELLDGQMVPINVHLVADVAADVKRGDWFFRDGHKYEVVWAVKVGGYETKAGVTDRG